jgi:arginine deiminase
MQTAPGARVHILDEVAPLKEVLVWGEPGVEALLGQLLPRSRSLFFSYYEVTEARAEFRRMQAQIETEGVKVIRAKDAAAQSLNGRNQPNFPESIRDLERLLLQHADEYYETFRQAKARDFAQEGIPHSIDTIYLQVKEDVRRILAEDVEMYGEDAAIRLNHRLSLAQPLPLANIFYGRDQSQALADQLVLTRLKWHIRRPEVRVFKEALTALGYSDLTEVEKGTLEGGDVCILDDTCYIGVGARTTLDAVKSLSRKIGPALERSGIQIVAVVNKRHLEEAALYGAPTDEHMRIMHLDMFWIPLRLNLVMAYGVEVDQRQVVRITSNSGQIVTEELGSFRKYLAGKGIEILEVNEQEQHNFATNLLNLGNDTVILALSKNERIMAELERRGFRVMSAELNKLVNGAGAIHCLTAPLRRGYG